MNRFTARFACVEAATGSAALEAAGSQRPSLAVLDVNLPDLSGYEVCHELRDTFGGSLPVLFVSGERGRVPTRSASPSGTACSTQASGRPKEGA